MVFPKGMAAITSLSDAERSAARRIGEHPSRTVQENRPTTVCRAVSNMKGMIDTHPHVVIIGGGFGGLYAAQSLKRAPVRVTLLDRRNFHLFQPLLYQVAMGGLSPANIAAPLRSVLKHQKNTQVLL